MKKASGLAGIVLLLAGLASCGGGGGGGGGVTPLSPPAFTNMAGTRWNQTDTVTIAGSCNAGLGIQDNFVMHVLAQSGNTISLYDERDGAGSASNATLSGYVLSYSGGRHPINCSSMSASYSVTLNQAETSYTGSATITCNDPPACWLGVSVTGSKL